MRSLIWLRNNNQGIREAIIEDAEVDREAIMVGEEIGEDEVAEAEVEEAEEGGVLEKAETNFFVRIPPSCGWRILS